MVSNGITILKIGGSVITDKGSEDGLVRIEEIERIAAEIRGFDGELIVVHGAGSFGHPQAKKYSLDKGFHAEGAVVTHNAVRFLNNIMVKTLNDAGVNAVAIHPIGCSIASDGRIVDMFVENILLMLDNGLVPVLHGDVVLDHVRGVSIVSGDQIVPYLAERLSASRIGLGSAANGVVDDRGETIARIDPDNFDYIKNFLGGSAGTDVTGGMFGKVLELLDLGKRAGSTSYIFNATISGNVTRFLNGENIGTSICDS